MLQDRPYPHCSRMADHDPHAWKTPYGGPYECSGKRIHEGGFRPVKIEVVLDAEKRPTPRG